MTWLVVEGRDEQTRYVIELIPRECFEDKHCKTESEEMPTGKSDSAKRRDDISELEVLCVRVRDTLVYNPALIHGKCKSFLGKPVHK